MRSPWPIVLLLLTGMAPVSAQQLCGKPVDKKWWTTPEREGWTQTSTSKEVRTLLRALHDAHPAAFQLAQIGTSLRGRPIQVATVRGNPDRTDRLRAVLLANIHGGEVEGKEALQILLREIVMGEHKDILAACDLWIVPIYNVDGNDEIQAGNRASQNGPEAVGMRRNTQDLDLNRDVVKAETPETRALLGLFAQVDPHLFMDLHTTNGSPHGYHLTYAPSLITNMDPSLDDFMHGAFLPKVRAAVKKNHGFRIFDYGNFGRGKPPSSWTTYGHEPRYAVNYFGLRNRLSLLSEAYSYLPFRERALVTRAFVLESLRQLVAERDKVLALCAAADRRVLAGGLRFGFDTRLRPAERGKILVGTVASEGPRRIAGPEARPVEMDLRIRFESQKFVDYPVAWVLPEASEAVRKILLIHGVEVHRLRAKIDAPAESFSIRSARRPRFQFEGHSLVTLRGEYVAGEHTLPKDSLVVLARQATARVAAQLLEARSEDSLATWNFFDASVGDKDGKAGTYPVLRVTKAPEWKLERLALGGEDATVDAAFSAAPKKIPANVIVVDLVCTKNGTRAASRGYETGARWVGREVVFRLGPQRLEKLADLRAAVVDLVANPSTAMAPYLLKPGNTITNAEILRVAQLLNEAGAKTVYLQREPE